MALAAQRLACLQVHCHCPLGEEAGLCDFAGGQQAHLRVNGGFAMQHPLGLLCCTATNLLPPSNAWCQPKKVAPRSPGLILPGVNMTVLLLCAPVKGQPTNKGSLHPPTSCRKSPEASEPSKTGSRTPLPSSRAHSASVTTDRTRSLSLTHSCSSVRRAYSRSSRSFRQSGQEYWLAASNWLRVWCQEKYVWPWFPLSKGLDGACCPPRW